MRKRITVYSRRKNPLRKPVTVLPLYLEIMWSNFLYLEGCMPLHSEQAEASVKTQQDRRQHGTI